MTAAVFRAKGSSHTCIRVSEGSKFVHFVPMESLKLERMEAREFYNEWEEFTTYPVRRAAQLYLGATQYREMDDKAREHLESIVADPATVFDARIFPQPKEETIMNAPAKQPATSKLASKASAAPAKTKVAGKADTKAPAKKAAPKAAPNGIDTVTKQAGKAPAKQAAPAKTAAPAKAAPVPRTSPNADQKLTVAEPDKARRGVTQEFVNEAIKLKTFTRQQLLDKMVAKGHDTKAARIKIADCVYFKVFVEA